MKRQELIENLVRIYDTRPENCSSYHIIDMMLYWIERQISMPHGDLTVQEFFNMLEEVGDEEI